MRKIINWVVGFSKTIYGAIITLIVFLASLAAVVTFVLQAPSLWRDFNKKDIPKKKAVEQLACQNIFNDTLNYKILVLPFFKTCETGRDVGLEIRNRLEILKYKDSLSVDVCYLDTFKQNPNFTKEQADEIRKKYKANQIIYGVNSSVNCTPQDTLLEVCVNYLVDKENINVRPISLNQVKASLSDIRQGFLQANIDNIVYYFSAISDLQKNKYRQSLYKLLKIKNINNSAAYYYFKGLLYENTSKYDSALANYSLAIKYSLKPGYFIARASLLRRYFNNYELAVDDCMKVVRGTKDTSSISSVLFELSLLRFLQGDYKRAIIATDAYFRYSKKDSSNFSDIYNVKGSSLAALDSNQKAIDCFTKSLKYDPKYHLSLEGRAEAFVKTYEYSKAMADYNALVKLKPKDEEYYLNRGALLLRMNNDSLADKDFNTALKLSNFSIRTYNVLADKKRDKGQNWESLRILEYIIAKEPNNVDINQSLGLTYGDLEFHAQAISYYNKVLRLDPKYYPAIFNRSVQYFMIGRYKEAIVGFNEYMKTHPDDRKSYYWRGMSKLNTGDNTAVADLDKSATMGMNLAKEYMKSARSTKYHK